MFWTGITSAQPIDATVPDTVAKRVVAGSAISTYALPNLADQENGAFTVIENVPLMRPWEGGFRGPLDNYLDVGSPQLIENTMTRATVGASFLGITQTQFAPPDPYLAVGPSHVVQVVNTQFRITTKTGTQTFVQGLGGTGLFSGMGVSGSVFDPKCLYDQHSGRFVIIILEVVGSTSSWILLAVSDDSDPNGTWYRYRTEATTTVNGINYWVDYPGLGVDENVIYVTGNLFRLSGSGSAGTKYRYFEKAPLLVNAPAVFRDQRGATDFSVQSAHTFGTALAQYFVTDNGTSSMKLVAIRNADTDTPVRNQSFLTVPSFSYPSVNVPNQGGSGLDPMDGRVMNASWRAGKLVWGHGIGASGKNVARWYEAATNNWPVSGSPSLIQSGNIDAGGTIHTWFPSLMQNHCGNTGVVLARSASTERASIQITGREAGDPLGTMQAMTQVQIGTSGYNQFRWGDYFGIAVDPVNDETFWCTGEYAVGTNNWRTWIASFSVGQCAIPCESPTVSPIANDSTACGSAYTSAAPSVSGTPPFVWTLTAGPAGMTINSGTGAVNWPNPLPSVTPYTVTVRATNDCGNHSRTWFLTVKPGDFNGDGLLTIADVTPLVNHLLGQDSSKPCAADVNLDGFIDGRDVQAFVNGM
jgi:hypothetical protein